MLRRIPRILRSAVIVAVLVAVSASVYQSWATGAPGTSGWTQTQWGPLGPADRDLLVKVRLAGLWEGPTGQQAEQMASSAEVREVGGKLAVEHAQLDEEVRKVADQLGVPLPSGPNAQQMGWMAEISSKTGSDYDRTFVQRVREAHGMVLPVISEVRASTQNDLVRQFAITSAEFVNRHHQYLEGTGLVDYAALPHHGPGLFGGGTEMSDLLVPFLVFVAALLAAIALFWGLRNRSTPGRRERVTLPQPSPRLPELAAVAAIPAPRATTIDDTGPIPLISDVGVSAATDTGSQRWAAGVTDSGRYDTVTTNGARTAVTDTGSQYAVTDTGSHRTVTDSGSHRAVTDTGSQRAVTDPDTASHRAVTGTGSQRAVTDSGSHRAVSTSGSHRMPRSRRARHSMRR